MKVNSVERNKIIVRKNVKKVTFIMEIIYI